MSEGTGAKRDNVALAIAAIVASVFALSLGDAVIKAFSVSFPLAQLYVLRSLLALPILVAIVLLRRKATSLLPIAPGWTALRSLMLAVMWIAYYVALPHIQLSVAAAAYYTSPLFITMIAALVVGERVGKLGGFAIILGFAGVLIMLRPEAGAFNAYGLLPIGAAILYAGAMVMTRTKCLQEDPMVLSLALNVTFILVGAVASLAILAFDLGTSLGAANPFLFGAWTSLGGTEWSVLALLAAVIVVGSLGAAIAYQAAPSSTVATFDYAYLAFATLWGLVVFAEIPDGLTLLGIVMIATAGILAVRR